MSSWVLRSRGRCLRIIFGIWLLSSLFLHSHRSCVAGPRLRPYRHYRTTSCILLAQSEPAPDLPRSGTQTKIKYKYVTPDDGLELLVHTAREIGFDWIYSESAPYKSYKRLREIVRRGDESGCRLKEHAKALAAMEDEYSDLKILLLTVAADLHYRIAKEQARMISYYQSIDGNLSRRVFIKAANTNRHTGTFATRLAQNIKDQLKGRIHSRPLGISKLEFVKLFSREPSAALASLIENLENVSQLEQPPLPRSNVTKMFSSCMSWARQLDATSYETKLNSRIHLAPQSYTKQVGFQVMTDGRCGKALRELIQEELAKVSQLSRSKAVLVGFLTGLSIFRSDPVLQMMIWMHANNRLPARDAEDERERKAFDCKAMMEGSLRSGIAIGPKRVEFLEHFQDASFPALRLLLDELLAVVPSGSDAPQELRMFWQL